MKINFFSQMFAPAIFFAAYSGYSQKTDEKAIKEMAEKACDCTKEIRTDIPKDSIVEKINQCIYSEVMMSQISAISIDKEIKTAVEKSADSSVDSVAVGGKNITILIDKDFEEIQEYMHINCPAVKRLMASDNIELKYSMSKNKKALAFYEEGIGYSDREEYDMAIVSFNKAVKADPKFAFAWDNLGICYRKRGNYKEAIKCYERSLKLDPNSKVPLMSMAVAYSLLEDYKQAAATYEKFIILNPKDPEGYFGVGRIYYIAEDYEKGVDNMFKAYNLYTEAKSPYVNDALQNLRFYYSDLEKKGKVAIFKQAAENNNVNID